VLYLISAFFCCLVSQMLFERKMHEYRAFQRRVARGDFEGPWRWRR
jgi:hypothetical protein